jgi:hypothetical protein
MATLAPRKKSTFLLAIILCAIGIFWVIASVLDADTQEEQKSALTAFTADIQAGGKLDTPEAFQARCGKAEKTEQQPGETVLHYGDLRIHFRSGQPVDLRRIAYGTWDQSLGEDFVCGRLKCKDAQ